MEEPVVSSPGMGPFHEAPVRDHSFVVCTPTLLNCRLTDKLNEGEPVHISLAEFKVAELIFRWKARLIQEIFPNARAIGETFVFHILIGLDIVQGDHSEN